MSSIDQRSICAHGQNVLSPNPCEQCTADIAARMRAEDEQRERDHDAALNPEAERRVGFSPLLAAPYGSGELVPKYEAMAASEIAGLDLNAILDPVSPPVAPPDLGPVVAAINAPPPPLPTLPTLTGVPTHPTRLPEELSREDRLMLETGAPLAGSVVLPTDAKARKATPMARGVLDYFPRALAAVAELSRIGNDQHNPGQPMHWAKAKSTDHADCIVRHTADRGTIDVDKVRHSSKVAWRALAQLEIELQAEEGDAEALRQVNELGTAAHKDRLRALGLFP